jgi:hypothetical protein
MGATSAQALVLERLLEGVGVGVGVGAGTASSTPKSKSTLLTAPGARLRRARDLPSPGSPAEVLPTGLPALDRLLARGLPKGRMAELSGRRSSGRFSAALSAIASATAAGESAALVDLGDHLDPQAALAAGVDLPRLLWVRPRKLSEALTAAEILLATGFALVVLDLGLRPGGKFLPDAAWVRLAREASVRGASLLLSTPWRVSGVAADVVVETGGARPVWLGRGSPAPLLAGLESRATLTRRGRTTPNRQETLRLKLEESFEAPRPAASRSAVGAA